MTTGNTNSFENVSKLLVGPLLFLVTLLLLQGWLEFQAKVAIGTVIWMACWWIMRPVHIAVTAMLPVVINSLFD